MRTGAQYFLASFREIHISISLESHSLIAWSFFLHTLLSPAPYFCSDSASNQESFTFYLASQVLPNPLAGLISVSSPLWGPACYSPSLAAFPDLVCSLGIHSVWTILFLDLSGQSSIGHEDRGLVYLGWRFFYWLLLLFSHSGMYSSLWPHELQHTRLSCPLLSPWVCSNSYPLSWWTHPTISSSVTPFSSCPQSFPASGFPNESALCIRWPKYWSFSISLSSECSMLISFRIDWSFD